MKNMIEEKLNQALAAPKDDVKYQAFINEYIMLLDQAQITTETTNIAIRAVELDQGVNFLDLFVSLEKKQIQDAWRVIRNCEEYKKNEDYNALKLICSFGASALGGDANTVLIIGNIFTALASLIRTEKQNTKVSPIVHTIIKKYMLEMLPISINLPEWKNIKMTAEYMCEFCEIMQEEIEKEEMNPTLFELKRWISTGKQYAEERKIIKEKEKNRPPRKSLELQALAKHFKTLEDEMDKVIHENVKLSLQINTMQTDLHKMELSEKSKEEKIEKLKKDIEGLTEKLKKANQEVNERKKLNDAQVQYREEAQISLLEDIAMALKPEYGDYAETIDVPMNEMLGEIYREKLKQIFKILDQKGVKVRS